VSKQLAQGCYPIEPGSPS